MMRDTSITTCVAVQPLRRGAVAAGSTLDAPLEDPNQREVRPVLTGGR